MEIISKNLKQVEIDAPYRLDLDNSFVTKFNNIFKFKGKEIKVAGNVNEPYFRAKDVLEILGYSETSSKTVLQRINNLFKKQYSELYTGSDYHEGKEIYVNKEGLSYLIAKCKLCSNSFKRELTDFFNLDLKIYETYEQQTILSIIEALKSRYECIPQFKILDYRIDLYLPELKLAIECDEYNHANYNKEDEKNREELIKKELNCEFFRYNPNSKNFSVYKLIADVCFFLTDLPDFRN